MKKILKILFVSLFLILLLSSTVDFIILTVNSEPITWLKFIKKYDRMYYYYKQGQIPQFKKIDVINEMIDEILIKQKASEIGISVKNEEVENDIKRILKDNNMTKEQFVNQLKYMGYDSYEEFFEERKFGFIKYRFFFEYINKISPKPTNEEVKSFYEKNKDKYKGTYKYNILLVKTVLPENYKLQDMINAKKALLEIKNLIESDKKLYNKANIKAIKELIKKIAEKYKIVINDELKNIYPEIEIKEFISKFIFILPDNLSDVFIYEKDYYLVYLFSKDKIDFIPLEDVKSKIYNYLEQENMQKTYENVIKKLKEEAIIIWYRRDVIDQ
ncbi:MAG: SurA N-terminal domain-containing protein [Spirochaetes bacterium]|nr:SurA N-terminal domain-containing protein [Spirochaetota bacterium]